MAGRASLLGYVEAGVDGGAAGWVLDVPGTYCWAGGVDAVLDALPTAARLAAAWLGMHGDEPPAAGSAKIDVAEYIVQDGAIHRGGTFALFLPDLLPATPDDIQRHATLLAWAREDLLHTLADIPGRAMGWRLPGGRSIREILHHLASIEWWYMSRFLPWPAPGGQPRDPIDALEWVRERCLDRLMHLTAAERAAVAHPDDSTARHIWGLPEPWTARKVLRRMLYHERYHTASLHRIVEAHVT